MNFLAHAYLSFGQKEILVGNMVSDFIKGKAQYAFPDGIRKGILLHRRIDQFADEHPSSKNGADIFRPYYRLYSAPIMDIVYDYFLANDTAAFPGDSLFPFTQTVYRTLEEFAAHLPLRFTQVFAYMKMENWLWQYREVTGIEKSLRGLMRRASFVKDSSIAYELFLRHQAELRQCYAGFFEDVKLFAKQQLVQLNEGL